MNEKGFVSEAEVVKWHDALDALCFSTAEPEWYLAAFEKVRECAHGDAKWLVPLFPAGARVTREELLRVMEAQGKDARALFLRGCISPDNQLLEQAAELGYAPAQARYGSRLDPVLRVPWARRAVAQGNRLGLTLLAECTLEGTGGCVRDRDAAVALFRRAADLDEHEALFRVGQLVYTDNDWQRFDLWSKAFARDNLYAGYCLAGAAMAAMRDNNMSSRVVFELGAACKDQVTYDEGEVYALGISADPENVPPLLRCTELHDQWCSDAREAIRCWLLTSRRLGLIKDMRKMIAGLLWERRAAWSEDRPIEWERPEKRRK
jgi:hypothetical protein